MTARFSRRSSAVVGLCLAAVALMSGGCGSDTPVQGAADGAAADHAAGAGADCAEPFAAQDATGPRVSPDAGSPDDVDAQAGADASDSTPDAGPPEVAEQDSGPTADVDGDADALPQDSAAAADADAVAGTEDIAAADAPLLDILDTLDSGAADTAIADAGADAAADAAVGDAVQDTVDSADSGDAQAFVEDVGGGLPSALGTLGTPKSLFDLQGIHTVKLTVAASEWAAFMDGVNQPDSEQIYDWHPATVEMDGVAYGQVGIHGFGNGSQLSNPAKPNVRLKFDKYVEGTIGPEGQKAFRLKSSGQDGTFLREILAGAMLRDAGGNAPRFSWARLWVNGQDFGPYLLQEAIDKRYFSEAIGNNDGDKFQVVYGCSAFECPKKGCGNAIYIWKGDPGDPQIMADLATALTTTNLDTFAQLLADNFYVGELMANYAVDAIISNIDGLAAAGQNFTVYTDEKTKRIHVISTGTDLTFGAKNAEYPLQQPWGSPNTWCAGRVDHVYERIWLVPSLKAKLLKHMRTLQCGIFRPQLLLPLVAAYQTTLTPMLTQDPKTVKSASQIKKSYTTLTDYVTKRQQALTDLLGPCP